MRFKLNRDKINGGTYLTRIDLLECDLCEQDTDASDLMHTECGKRFCPSCDDDGAVYWILCDETGEDFAHLA